MPEIIQNSRLLPLLPLELKQQDAKHAVIIDDAQDAAVAEIIKDFWEVGSAHTPHAHADKSIFRSNRIIRGISRAEGGVGFLSRAGIIVNTATNAFSGLLSRAGIMVNTAGRVFFKAKVGAEILARVFGELETACKDLSKALGEVKKQIDSFAKLSSEEGVRAEEGPEEKARILAEALAKLKGLVGHLAGTLEGNTRLKTEVEALLESLTRTEIASRALVGGLSSFEEGARTGEGPRTREGPVEKARILAGALASSGERATILAEFLAKERGGNQNRPKIEFPPVQYKYGDRPQQPGGRFVSDRSRLGFQQPVVISTSMKLSATTTVHHVRSRRSLTSEASRLKWAHLHDKMIGSSANAEQVALTEVPTAQFYQPLTLESSNKQPYPETNKYVGSKYNGNMANNFSLYKYFLFIIFGNCDYLNRINKAGQVLASHSNSMSPLDWSEEQLKQGIARYGSEKCLKQTFMSSK